METNIMGTNVETRLRLVESLAGYRKLNHGETAHDGDLFYNRDQRESAECSYGAFTITQHHWSFFRREV